MMVRTTHQFGVPIRQRWQQMHIGGWGGDGEDHTSIWGTNKAEMATEPVLDELELDVDDIHTIKGSIL